MACCLMAITWTNVDWSSVKSSDIHIRAISQEMPQPSITKIHLKITYLQFHVEFLLSENLNFWYLALCVFFNVSFLPSSGGFMIIRNNAKKTTKVLDFMATAPAAVSETTYDSEPDAAKTVTNTLHNNNNNNSLFSQELHMTFISLTHVACWIVFEKSNRADPKFAPRQWETGLLRNDVSHWLSASLE